MFDQIDFERKFYKLIVGEVNAVFSQLMNDCERSSQVDLIKEGLKMQRQIMEVFHGITEESVMQMSVGLLAHKQSQSGNFQLDAVGDMKEQDDE